MKPREEALWPKSVPGMYRWTDCGYYKGWRVQAHYRGTLNRVLAPNRRTAFQGDAAACRNYLSSVVEQQQLALPTGPVVVVLHGLSRNAWTMLPLSHYLQSHWPEAEVINFQYASNAASIDQHAQHLVSFLDYARCSSGVHFVGHSLGNIVVRRAFRMAEEGQWQLPKLGRCVMLGPPNQGAQIAHRLRGLWPLAWFNGAPFMQLGRDWSTYSSQLAIPTCPFGVIAGSVPLLDKVHPFVRGPSDVLVSVEETRLPGAADFLVMPIGHTWFMVSRRVQQATLRFLTTGRFKE